MDKVATNIELTDHTTKWAMVEVFNADGSLNRQYAITKKDAEAVFYGNNVLPPGCTKEEWFEGRTIVGSRVCNPGQAVQMPDGTLMFNQGIEESNGKIFVDLIKIAAAHWDKTDTVNLSTDIIDLVNPEFKK